MSAHDYVPEQAVEVLLRKLGDRDPTLEGIVRAAINAGKDIPITEPPRNSRGKARTYRQTAPLTHQEALRVALNALRAYFVELPLFINSAAENFATAAVGVPRPTSWGWDEREPDLVNKEAQGTQKDMEIELETATQISRTQRETMPLKALERQQVEDQVTNMRRLVDLFTFIEDKASGDSH